MSIDASAILLGAQPLAGEAEIAAQEGPTPGAGESATILVAGDLCVTAGTGLPSRGQPLPWASLSAEIGSHDVALVNLECPLTDRPRTITKSGPALWGDPALAQMIADGGFTGVTLANNHVLDAGADGVMDTLDACGRAGLATVGAGEDVAAAEKPLITEAGGLRVGIVACAEREFSIAGRRSPGAAPLDPWRTPELVREAALAADVVVVVLHGGNEFAAMPRPGLVTACRGLVSAGARAVVCHHSHVAGPAEVVHGAPIFYGTGNFLFPDDIPARAWHLGYAVSLTLTSDGVRSARIVPYDQSVEGLAVRPLGEEEQRAFVAALLRGGVVVADRDLLAIAWSAHCVEQRRHYLHMALGLTRPERRLLRYGGWPSWRRARRRLPELLDILTCDSHREALEHILRMETRG